MIGVAMRPLEKLNEFTRGGGEIVRRRRQGTERVGAGDERALLEEMARIGYLIEHGFGIQLSANSATDAGVDSSQEGVKERRRPAGRNDA